MRKKRRGRVLQYCRLFRRDPHAPDAIGTALESAFWSPRTRTITKSHLVIDKCDLGSELGSREQWSNHFTPLFVHQARSQVRYVQHLTPRYPTIAFYTLPNHHFYQSFSNHPILCTRHSNLRSTKEAIKSKPRTHPRTRVELNGVVRLEVKLQRGLVSSQDSDGSTTTRLGVWKSAACMLNNHGCE